MPRFYVERSIEISASPERVFETVSDFGTWTTWSPWLCAEPDAEVTVSENSNSVGSLYSWKGELVGEGEVEHQELEVGRTIADEIRFIKPFRSTSRVGFTLQPVSEGTRLNWYMDGSLPWFLFFLKGQTETIISMDYDRGLKMVKELLETGEIQSQTKIHGVESVGPLRMAGVHGTCSLDDVGLATKAAFEEAHAKLSQHGLPTDGQPMSVYHHMDCKARTFEFTSGFTLPDNASDVPNDLNSWSIPNTQALKVEHIGRYDNLGNAWSAANQFARYKKLKQGKLGAYEVYVSDPQNTPTAELRTEVILTLK